MNRIYRKIVVATTSMLLAGCGGGGGGGGGDNASAARTDVAAVETPPVVTPVTAPASGIVASEPEVAAAISRTAELVASNEFSFTSSYQLELNVNRAEVAAVPQYLTVCRQSEVGSEAKETGYEACLLRSPMPTGRFEGTVSVTSDVDQLAIALWRFDGTSPEIVLWDRTRDGDRVFID
ncbi:MAG: hypothetical protein ACFHX7_12210 [Pseudomonadota bacterium]